MFRISNALSRCHDDSIWSVTWSHASNTIVTAGLDQHLRFWDAATLINAADEGVSTPLTPSAKLDEAHSLPVVSISCAADSDKSDVCVSSGLDGVLCVMDVREQKQLQRIECGPAQNWVVALTADGSQVCTAAPALKQATIFNCSTGKKCASIDLGTPEVSPLSVRYVCSSSERLLVGCTEGQLVVADVKMESCVTRIKSSISTGIRSIAVVDDNVVLCASEDSSIGVFDVRADTQVAVLSAHSGWVLDVVAMPVGASVQRFVSCSSDRSVKVWELRTREVVHTFDGAHTDQVCGLALGPSGTDLVSVSDDASMRFYSIADK